MQARLGGIRAVKGADDPERNRYWEKRHAVHLLTQEIHCGRFGGLMTNTGRDYMTCQTARKLGTRPNTRGMRRRQLDALILDVQPP